MAGTTGAFAKVGLAQISFRVSFLTTRDIHRATWREVRESIRENRRQQFREVLSVSICRIAESFMHQDDSSLVDNNNRVINAVARTCSIDQ